MEGANNSLHLEDTRRARSDIENVSRHLALASRHLPFAFQWELTQILASQTFFSQRRALQKNNPNLTMAIPRTNIGRQLSGVPSGDLAHPLSSRCSLMTANLKAGAL